jgi:CRP/FNR family transcriptional activator FtrB
MKLKSTESLRRLPLLKDLDDSRLSELAEGASIQRYPKGTVLFDPGDRPDFLYVLTEGAVELVGRDGDRETVMEILWPVQAFILAAVLTDTPLLMAARTLETSSVILVEAANLRRCVAEDPVLAAPIIGMLAGQFRMMARQVMDLKLRTGTQRLACFLLSLVDDVGDGSRARLPFPKGTLAARLGMTPENLSRAFRALAETGLLVRGQEVFVENRAAVEEYCRPNRLIDDVERNLSLALD